MSLRDRVYHFNSAPLATAKLHVRKSKAVRYTKTRSTPELREAIKQRYGLRRAITVNGAESTKACASTCKLSENARQKKWEEFLANLENNPDPIRACLETQLYSIYNCS